MTLDLAPPFADLTFMTPLSPARADALVAFLASTPEGTVLDLGCGWAELLLRVIEAAQGLHGVGIDLDQSSIEHGTALAAARDLSDRVVLHHGDARHHLEHLTTPVHAVVCIGASQIWGPPVEDNQPLDYAGALASIRALVPRGGRVVFGEGIWSRPPTEAAAAPLSGRLDELVSLPELVDIAVAAGFMPVQIHEANQDEWDEFESGYSACYATWLATHGQRHPDAAQVHALAARQRAGYLEGYRGVMGLAYLALLAV